MLVWHLTAMYYYNLHPLVSLSLRRAGVSQNTRLPGDIFIGLSSQMGRGEFSQAPSSQQSQADSTRNAAQRASAHSAPLSASHRPWSPGRVTPSGTCIPASPPSCSLVFARISSEFHLKTFPSPSSQQPQNLLPSGSSATGPTALPHRSPHRPGPGQGET